LRSIDPVKDGKITKAEVTKYLRGLKWSSLYQNYENFFKAFKKWENSCFRKGPAGRTAKYIWCNKALLTLEKAKKLAEKANPIRGNSINRRTPRAKIRFSANGSGRYIEISFYRPWSRYWPTYPSPSGPDFLRYAKFGRLHQVRDVKVIKVKPLVYKVLVYHISGKVSEIRADWRKGRRRPSFWFVKNPTKAKLVRPKKRVYLEPPPII